MFDEDSEAEIKFLTEDDIVAFFLTVNVDGYTLTYGNDRTQVKEKQKILLIQIPTRLPDAFELD